MDWSLIMFFKSPKISIQRERLFISSHFEVEVVFFLKINVSFVSAECCVYYFYAYFLLIQMVVFWKILNDISVFLVCVSCVLMSDAWVDV